MNQTVGLQFDDNKEKISLTFMPGNAHFDFPNLDRNSTPTPSVFSLYDHDSFTFPLKKEDDGFSFSGDFETSFFNFGIDCSLVNNGKDASNPDGNNLLTILIKSKKLKNTFDWNTTDVFRVRPRSKDIGYLQCCGFWCDTPDAKIPCLEKYDISPSEFFNCLFNIEFVKNDSNNYAPCINRLFNAGALSFLESGELISGNCLFIEYTPHGLGGFEGMVNLIYEPSAIQFIPISDTQIKLFVNNDMTAPVIKDNTDLYNKSRKMTQENKLEITKKNQKLLSGTFYSQVWTELYNSLFSEIAVGLNMRKTLVETLPNGDMIYLLSFDESVARKMMTTFVNQLQEPDRIETFLYWFPKNVTGKFYIPSQAIRTAINALPQFIASTPNLQLGFQICLPKNKYKPFEE